MRALVATLVSLPALAFAHPGHSQFPADTAAHYLLTPEHAAGPVLALAAAVFVALLMWRVSRRLD